MKKLAPNAYQCEHCGTVLLWCLVGGCVELVGSWVGVLSSGARPVGSLACVSCSSCFVFLLLLSCAYKNAYKYACGCCLGVTWVCGVQCLCVVVCVDFCVFCSFVLLFSSWWVVVCWSCCGVLLVGVFGSWARGLVGGCVVVWGSSCWFLGVCLLLFLFRVLAALVLRV